MDTAQLFEPLKNMEMPSGMQDRIIRSCRMHRRNVSFKRPAVIAAILVLALGLTAAAAGCKGYFQDIKNMSGAVTGTKYLQASDEIAVRACLSGGTLTVSTEFILPDTPPYSEIKEVCLGSYQLIDVDGKTLYKGENSSPSLVICKKADIKVSLENSGISSGKLIIDSFIGLSKADQPLEIIGHWEVSF